ncbi:hypothetical protein RND71_033771 [Anisodus tanguticus]|uniref:Uncharacterized protein n=1 Tax=Anisodus tanguticus TaxID=243964 RepID=A0AAE1RBH4_9SOLA|nr:hypothetical protein RND71_033771 [Anisodus tanguticus]
MKVTSQMKNNYDTSSVQTIFCYNKLESLEENFPSILYNLIEGWLVCPNVKKYEDVDSDGAVYIVTLKQAPVSHLYSEELRVKGHHHHQHHHSKNHGSGNVSRLDKPSNASHKHAHNASSISRMHDSLLRKVLRGEKYLKLYSYHYLINGFAVLVTPQQAFKLANRREVSNVALDFSVRTATTHTPQFLGLPLGAWVQEGGYETAGEGIVIGFIDTGIDPMHLSFSDNTPERHYPVPQHFSGICEVTRDFPSGSCNRKLVGARHFAASAITRGIFNTTQDYASPFDGDGHGTHTVSIAAGNHGICVVVAGHHFGDASGMAPRAHVAVYKALYKSFGGFAADVVAAIDQAELKGVSEWIFRLIFRSVEKVMEEKAGKEGSTWNDPQLSTGPMIPGGTNFEGPRAPLLVPPVAPISMVPSMAAQDGVDIINLSITPNRRPPGVATFFNPIDMALLSAVKAGIFVVQAAGNTGPSPKSMSSFSPWIFTVGASTHDRVYSNSIVLGNNITIPGVGLAPGADSMYTLVMASHALNDTAANDMYVGECQDASSFNQTLVQGNLLVCSYSVRFVLGLSTIKQALETAKNLSAAGVVFCMDPFVIGFQINPTPMRLPGIIIPSANDSKILLQYYNSSLDQDAVTKKITQFGAVACISGGLKANFSLSAPNVMFYSARGPDPEDSFLDDADILKPNLVAPGNSIWAAWSSGGMDSVEFEGSLTKESL